MRVTAKADLLDCAALKSARLRDGTFWSVVFGYSDNIRASVTVRNARIADIQLDHREKADQNAHPLLPERIKEKK